MDNKHNMLRISKKDLLATLELAGVTMIHCRSHCNDAWSLDYVFQNREDFQIDRVMWTGDGTEGIAYTFFHKQHKDFE